MYCEKCGHPIEENSTFCNGCGARLNTENKTTPVEEPFNGTGGESDSSQGFNAPGQNGTAVRSDAYEPQPSYNVLPEPKMKPKKKRLKLPAVIAVILVAVLGVAAAAVFGVSARDTKKYDERIVTGNKYLEEMNYEEAVETFLEAIDIKPKRQEAYTGAAKGYIGLQEPDKAKDILKKGLENIKEPDGEFLDLCDDLGVAYEGQENAISSAATESMTASETAADTKTQATATTQPTTKPETTANSLSESDLKAILGKKTKGTIVYFAYDDFDSDSQKEAFALVGKIDDIYIDADVWFVNSTGAVNLFSASGVDKDSFKTWDLGQQKIFKFEQSGGGSDSESFAWFVNNNKAVKINNTGQQLTYLGEKNFSTAIGEFDAGYDSEYDSWTGHTWKRYYLYWDGSGFKEYGGIAISKAQLLQLKGAQEIINSIEQTGAVVTDIFYRGNDIININYKDSNEASYSADNATLKRSGNTVKLVQVYPGDATDLQNFSYQGIYKAAMTPSIAVYPSKFP